ncbi:selection and upkeep of intraepithelial T-cells protein 1-like [Suncus etruscus]|uniref:selection and upkeep of intraepithelial T-cells protein 1-like n=1 Tax=Suncus etruscus TaxID=109475 RepID=UPI00210F9D5C|nr:selection and upkeep of intraepithelial T-cells protein 1-like [Suncus etruscus]
MEPEFPPVYKYFMALAILQIRGLYSEQFTVSSSWSHQVVTVGGQAELSCQISPPQNANHMDVGWFRDHYTQMIHTHKDGKEITEKNIQNSKDRTVLLKDDLGTGKMILQIHNITVFDGGKYYCFFKDGDTYEEASTDLRVAAVGLEIQISVQVSDTNGFLLECASGGWFPQPTMQLRDSRRQIIPHPSKIYSEDKSGLFHSKMSILLKNSTQSHIICCFYNSLTGQEKNASIFLSGSWYYIIFESLPFLLLNGIFPTYLKFKNEGPRLPGLAVKAILAWRGSGAPD